MKTSLLTLVVFSLLLAACNRPAAPEAAAPEVTSEVPATDAPAGAMPVESIPPVPAAFVDKVWQVRESSAVASGTRYSFLGDGTLVIDSDAGPPGYGRWTFENGALTMSEDGIPYPTDILALDGDSFEIRSHNPGEPVTIVLVPAVGVPLPAAPAQD